MKYILVAMLGVGLCGFAGADNLIKNGTFENDAKGVNSMKTVYKKVDGKNKGVPVKGVNFTKHNTEQGADGSKGCLEIDFTVTKDEQVYIHNTGIWIKAVKRVPGSKEKPARAKVTMMVKSLDKEPGYLHVTRLWGAGSTTVFKLTPEWQKVETVITSPYPVGDLLLVPVNKKHRIVSGKVLVDNVEVKAAEEK